MHSEDHDNPLRRSLSDYDSPLDLDAGWAALERARKPRKRRRGGAWWWYGSSLLLLFVLGTLLLWSRGFSWPNQTSGTPPAPARSATTTSPIDQSPPPDAPSSVVPASVDPMVVESAIPTSTGTTLPKETSRTQKGSSLVTTHSLTTETPPSSPINRSPTPFSGNTPFDDQSFPASPRLVVDATAPHFDPPPALPAVATPTTFGPLSRLPFPVSALLDYTVPLPGLPVPSSPLPHPEKTQSWTVSAYGEYGKSFRSDGPSSTPLEALRARTETALDYYRTGMGVRYSPNRKWSIGTRLHYARHTDRLSLSNSRTDSIVTNSTLTITQQLNGTETTTTGPATGVRRIDARRRHYLRYTAVGLDVNGGRQWILGSNWILRSNLGVRLAFSQSATGTTFGDAQDWSQQTDISTLDYRTGGSWSGLVDLGLQYYVTENWTLHVQGTGSYGLSGQRTGNARTERRHELGLRLGVARSW